MVSIFQTFCALIQRDIMVFLPTYKDRIINSIIWAIITLVVFQYVMPSLGLPKSFAAFIAASNAASWGFFEVTENVGWLIADLEGHKAIGYDLTLPLPQWMVFIRIAISNGIKALLVATLFIPVAKIILGAALDLSNISFLKLGIILIMVHLFYGMFGLYLTSKTKNMMDLSNIWMRIVFPLWYLGCYQFPWSTLYKLSPTIAYINLLNPIVYCMEGMRSALLGAEASAIPFYYSVVALMIFCAVAAHVGVSKMRKRLDCL
jgi:ABC-type polysaccharide/polyol phosphate export permease